MTLHLFTLSLILTATSCSRSQVPVFDENGSFGYLEKQCSFGPRNPGSDGHARCLAFLYDELGKYADSVVKQPFFHTISQTNESYHMTNIVASFGKQSHRMLLCAHWDTRPWADSDPDPRNHDSPILGANDGARRPWLLRMKNKLCLP